MRDHDPMPIGAVRHHAADRRNQKHRNLAGEPDRPQQQRRSRQAIHQPRLGDRLHPGADQRDQLAGKEQLKVAMPKARTASHTRERGDAGAVNSSFTSARSASSAFSSGLGPSIEAISSLDAPD